MTHTTPLPPLPDLTALSTNNPVLAEPASRPDTRVAFYDDSPYVTPAAHTEAQR